MNDYLRRGIEAVEDLREKEEEERAPAFLSLEELLNRPDLLQPPVEVVPRLGYRGRLVILAGPDKSGKSTLLSHAMTAVSKGRTFLGAPVTVKHQRAVLLGLEEALGDAVRRFSDLGAYATQIKLLTLPDDQLLARTNELLAEWPTDLLVIDSLQEFARVMLGKVPDDGDNSGWSSVVRPLVNLARKHDIAVVLLHHVRKSDGTYRGASEIAAAADALLEMSMPKSDESPNLRRITGRGRWNVEPFAVELVDGQYELSGGGTLSMDARIIIYVENHHGASKNALRQAIGGRASAVDARINALLARGALVDRGAAGRMALYPPSAEPQLGVA